MVDEAKAQKKIVGIYTSLEQWRVITKDSKKFKGLPVWYSRYDGKANYDDFKKFGGWTMPTMKQFNPPNNVCNVTFEKDWSDGWKSDAKTRAMNQSDIGW
jgi:hypothetical protein